MQNRPRINQNINTLFIMNCSSSSFNFFSKNKRNTMSDSYQNSNEKAGDLSNIHQGDDSNHGLNSSLNNMTDFGITGGQDNRTNSNPFMGSHNQCDHDIAGRFNPYGGLPNVPTHMPGDPSFTRQTGPLMGGKHINDNGGSIQAGDAASGPTFSLTDPCVPELIHNAAPQLVKKRNDEAAGDDVVGLDPSQGKLKMD
jgi:hypothetical protein